MMPRSSHAPLHSRRWMVLAMVALVMMAGYIFWDVLSPLSTTLKAPAGEGGLGWTAAEYGFYAGSYSIFNIFFLMLFFGGVILDRCGIRLTGLLATGSMLLGAMVNWYAVARMSPEPCLELSFTLFGLIPSPVKVQVLTASLSFALFGMGCDITGITVSKIVTKWFTGHELASAMGIQVALARLGTASALSFSPLIALRHGGVAASLAAGVAVLAVGFVLFVAYLPMDKRFDEASEARGGRAAQGVVVSSPAGGGGGGFGGKASVIGFCLIALLCVFFYGSIRPFMKFATDLMVSKYGVAETTAGWIVAAIPYGTIVLTPLFGSLYDRAGHGARLMLAGCVLVVVAHVCLLLPSIHEAWFALAVMLLVGVAFSLVPSALWPSVPKLVPLRRLGTAYSIIYFIQNIGLMLIPMWVGRVVGRHTAADGRADYTAPMAIFLGFGLCATVAALLLLLLDRRAHIGLEDANIK